MNKSKTNCRNKGFTLIELLVVISIIGIMASVVLASLNDARVGAQYAVAKQTMKQIADATLLINNSQSMMGVTFSNCSDCVCRFEYGGPADLKNLPATHACMIGWTNAITRIDAASTLLNGTNGYLRDPWGSPYLLDENEGEWAAPDNCINDFIRTAGPDGQTTTADDYLVPLPLRTSACLGR